MFLKLQLKQAKAQVVVNIFKTDTISKPSNFLRRFWAATGVPKTKPITDVVADNLNSKNGWVEIYNNFTKLEAGGRGIRHSPSFRTWPSKSVGLRPSRGRSMLRKRKRRRRRPKFWKTPRRRASLTPPAPSKTGPNHPPARPTPPNLQDLTDQPNGWKQAAAAAAAAPGAKGDEAPPVPPQAESTSARPKSVLKPAQGRHTKSDGGRNVSLDEPTPEEKAKHAQEDSL